MVLWIESERPLSGSVGVSAAPPVAFADWLDLLAQLAHLVEPDTTPVHTVPGDLLSLTDHSAPANTPHEKEPRP